MVVVRANGDIGCVAVAVVVVFGGEVICCSSHFSSPVYGMLFSMPYETPVGASTHLRTPPPAEPLPRFYYTDS